MGGDEVEVLIERLVRSGVVGPVECAEVAEETVEERE